MKKFILLFLMMLTVSPLMLFAQDVVEMDPSNVVLDFTTYGGLAAIVGMVIVQIGKLIPAVNNNKWLKILCSLIVGIAIAVVVKAIGITSPIADLSWGSTVIAGLITGGSSCGLYDLISSIIKLFKKEEEV